MSRIPDKKFAFVLMPFDRKFDDIYRLGILGAVATFDDMEAQRVDEQFYKESMLERIYAQIALADIVIADMSGQNPNVFYEVGYAHARGKLCILLTSDAGDIPFDLKHRRHIVYNKSITFLREELVKHLVWARDEVEKERNSHIKVTPQAPVPLLTMNDWSATGDLTFKIDVENVSPDRAVNIQAMYFYSTKAWTLFQDDKECPHSTPQPEPYIEKVGWEKRHFLNPPLPWLQKGAWAQLQFRARKALAFAFRGERLEKRYPVKGLGLLRVVTPEGNFDYEIPIDVTFDEDHVPF